ncbi:dual specificity protein kinase yak1 [Apophysomyces ossiformis]|uniref:Dual specificity protein kinase yak1 n=1 Tax=Apophysomyces ossiformis TaxID=679940 RepID=A0A8H7BTE5_9FUNG|nr:dual specificity protein kinase yak1 [Apophysomyces ossiformis]
MPLFPGRSEYDQLEKIVDMLGLPPSDILDKGKNTSRFFQHEVRAGKVQYKLKTREQFSQQQQKPEPRGKRYFSHATLEDIILHHENESTKRRTEEECRQGVLHLNPLKRWTPQQAQTHPFISGKTFSEPFYPDLVPSIPPVVTAPFYSLHTQPASPLALHVISQAEDSISSLKSSTSRLQLQLDVEEDPSMDDKKNKTQEQRRIRQRVGRGASPHPVRLKHQRTFSKHNPDHHHHLKQRATEKTLPLEFQITVKNDLTTAGRSSAET